MLKGCYIDLNCECSKEELQTLYNLLISDRRAVVDRLVNAEMKKKQIITGAFLQYALCTHLQIPAGNLKFTYNEHGKPGLEIPGVHFNMSHSGDYAMIVISDHPVGVDIEKKRTDKTGVAKRCFCRDEYDDIMSGKDEAEVADRFLEYWTLKEAYVKYLGRGLSVPFNSFKLICEGKEYRVAEGDKAFASTELALSKDVILRSYGFARGYRYSVCFETGCMADSLVGDGDDFKPKKVDIRDIMSDVFWY